MDLILSGEKKESSGFSHALGEKSVRPLVLKLEELQIHYNNSKYRYSA
jgi:hypothetical protein